MSGVSTTLDGAGDVEGEGGVEGCDEGADDVEQGASMAARVAEGDDEDEAMAGDENVSGQRAEGGVGYICYRVWVHLL